ncbi:MAG TPA: hypothetical protein PKC30_04630 [Saprospiraceae bacterium]|nr:hypothetical protein [Saprospiraceae bacterium]
MDDKYNYGQLSKEESSNLFAKFVKEKYSPDDLKIDQILKRYEKNYKFICFVIDDKHVFNFADAHTIMLGQLD